jgi:outer membrane protein assembly factor BamB
MCLLAIIMSACSGSSNSPQSTPTPTPTPTPPVTRSSGTDVVTYHNDVARTGENVTESVLTPANVNSSSFGKVGFLAVDGKVDAQPLLLAGVNLGSQGTQDVVYVVTEHDSVYALDAASGKVYWQVSLLGAGETTSDNHGCSQITPEIGITSTPVIDRANNVIYAVAMSKDGSGNYFQRLHALNLTTGAEMPGGPVSITATYPGNGEEGKGGTLNFMPGQHAERTGLLLVNGMIYTMWTSHCDIQPYTGWVIAYNASTLAQASVLNVTPNGSEGSMWMSGAGPAADSAGNIYFLDANGTFDTTLNASGFPGKGDFGNAMIKLSTANGLKVSDYFATFDTVSQSNMDGDLGSGGALVLPDLTDASGAVRHLAVGAGKDKKIYVVDRDNMGKFNPGSNHIYQEIQGVLANGEFGMPAYFNNTVYYGAVGDALKAFPITAAKLASAPASQSRNSFPYPGTTPSVSANGSSDGIVWAVENGSTAVLHAYDAGDLSHELYNSNQAGSRDQFGAGNKFITPMIANGRVYVGTTNGVAVFGKLQ